MCIARRCAWEFTCRRKICGGMKMRVRRIGYLLLLALGGYFTMLYNFQGLRFLLCCAVCIPLACLLLLAPCAFLCQIQIRINNQAGQAAVTRGEPVKVVIQAKNRGLLPAAGMFVVLRWQAPGEKEMTVRRWMRGVRRGHGQEAGIEFPAAHCGKAVLVAAKAGVCDYLGIFSLPVKVRRREEICIMPQMTPIPGRAADLAALRSLLWGGERDGDMFLRDFQPGDSIHRVYWKLSAKPGELQVRDRERSGLVRIFLNYPAGFGGQEWDRFLDRACSILYFLLEEAQSAGAAVDVLWRQGENLRGYEIRGADAVQGWVYALLMREDTGRLLGAEEFPSLKGGKLSLEGSFLTEGCHLEEDCRLYFGDQCVYE